MDQTRMMTKCWGFREGSLNNGGYGQARVNGQTELVHRAAYEAFIGPIPAGLELDHLCRNRACYNPRHLEPVTRQENLRRGEHRNRRKITCPRGHVYDFVRPDGRRRCRSCEQQYAAERRELARA